VYEVAWSMQRNWRSVATRDEMLKASAVMLPVPGEGNRRESRMDCATGKEMPREAATLAVRLRPESG